MLISMNLLKSSPTHVNVSLFRDFGEAGHALSSSDSPHVPGVEGNHGELKTGGRAQARRGECALGLSLAVTPTGLPAPAGLHPGEPQAHQRSPPGPLAAPGHSGQQKASVCRWTRAEQAKEAELALAQASLYQPSPATARTHVQGRCWGTAGSTAA